MPLYYFDIHNGDETEDFEGAEFADDQAAHAYAVVAARGLAAETVKHGHLTIGDTIEIRNQNRETIGKVTFGEAIDIRS